jgi:ubiquinone/menaquinone biosynthesis C-methylase UbiE
MQYTNEVFTNPNNGIPEDITRLYEVMTSKHDDPYLQNHARRTMRTVQVLLDEKPKGKLLELGTSKVIPLLLQELQPELEVHVTDFDLSQKQTGEMSISLGSFSCISPVYRVDLEQQTLPIESESFDYVLCCEVIEHMELDPMFMMSEINRVLKPQGTLILTTPNITSSRALWKMLRGMEPHFYMQYRKTPSYHRHNYEYSVSGLRSVMKAAGFGGDVWSEDSFENPVIEDVTRLREIGYPLVDIGDNIFAVVKKHRDVINRYPSVIYSD